MMAICRGWLDGARLMRCKVGPGFKAVVGVGNDVHIAAGDPNTNGIPCDQTAPTDKLQILSDLYDSKNSLYDEDHNYAPGVLMCEFAATDADNIVDSFAKTEPFHVDKRGKDGILTHTDPKGDMPEDADTPAPAVTPTDALTRTVNGTGHTGPSEFCATSI